MHLEMHQGKIKKWITPCICVTRLGLYLTNSQCCMQSLDFKESAVGQGLWPGEWEPGESSLLGPYEVSQDASFYEKRYGNQASAFG